jgi:hypothetical protein
MLMRIIEHIINHPIVAVIITRSFTYPRLREFVVVLLLMKMMV